MATATRLPGYTAINHTERAPGESCKTGAARIVAPIRAVPGAAAASYATVAHVIATPSRLSSLATPRAKIAVGVHLRSALFRKQSIGAEKLALQELSAVFFLSFPQRPFSLPRTRLARPLYTSTRSRATTARFGNTRQRRATVRRLSRHTFFCFFRAASPTFSVLASADLPTPSSPGFFLSLFPAAHSSPPSQYRVRKARPCTDVHLAASHRTKQPVPIPSRLCRTDKARRASMHPSYLTVVPRSHSGWCTLGKRLTVFENHFPVTGSSCR